MPGVTPVIRSTTQAAMNTTTRVATVTTPSSTEAGDWLVAIASHDWGRASQLPTPGGGGTWTRRALGNTGEINQVHTGMWLRRVTTDGAQTVTSSGAATNADVVLLVLVLDGDTVDPDDPFDVGAGSTNGGASAVTSHVAPSVDPVNDGLDGMLLCVWASQGSSSAARPYVSLAAGMSQVGTQISSRTYVTQLTARRDLTGTAAQADAATGTTNASTSIATGYASCSLAIKGRATPPPPAVPISNLADAFETGVDEVKWPDRGLVVWDPVRRAASIPVRYSGGQTQWAWMRSAYAYSLLAAESMTVEVIDLPGGAEGFAQLWMTRAGAEVGRAGFEYVSGADRLDFLVQGPGYSILGTTVSITAPGDVHRWWRLTLDSINGLQWWTSYDRLAWSLQRTVPPAEVASTMPWMNGQDLALSAEGFRLTGVTNSTPQTFVLDHINIPRPPEPAWTPAMTGGAVTWGLDMSQPDAVAAGYDPSGSQRQSGSGTFNDPTVPWPPPIEPAPYGRAGRAFQLRVPDNYRRYEVVPPLDYVDGDEFFVGFSLLIEPDVDREYDYYQLVWQLHQASGSGSPPIALELLNGDLLVTGGSNRPNPVTGASAGNTYNHRQTVMPDVPAMTWLDVVIYVGVWSQVNSGRMDVWINGAHLLQNYRPPSGTNYFGSGDLAYPKNGLYHHQEARGGTVWFSDHRHGTSYAAVAPSSSLTEYAPPEPSGFAI